MMPSTPDRRDKASHLSRSARYSEWMTVRDMLTALQTLPRDAELLAFEAGCEDYCEREVDDYLASWAEASRTWITRCGAASGHVVEAVILRRPPRPGGGMRVQRRLTR
jgi:hypothetical protein